MIASDVFERASAGEDDDGDEGEGEGEGEEMPGWDENQGNGYVSGRELARLMALFGAMRPKGASDRPDEDAGLGEGAAESVAIEVIVFDPTVDPSPESDRKARPTQGRGVKVEWHNNYASDGKGYGGSDAVPDEVAGGLPDIGGVDPHARGAQLFRAPLVDAESVAVAIGPNSGRISLGAKR